MALSGLGLRLGRGRVALAFAAAVLAGVLRLPMIDIACLIISLSFVMPLIITDSWLKWKGGPGLKTGAAFRSGR